MTVPQIMGWTPSGEQAPSVPSRLDCLDCLDCLDNPVGDLRERAP